MPVNVVRTYAELESLVKTNYTEPDLTTLRKAYEVANTAHEKAVRLTGHPFITHPIAVAYKLAEMGLHVNVVIAGMLHDVVEDSDVTIEDVQAQFGDDIASLVNNMSKIKGELEDAAFAYLMPKEYERMKTIMDIKVRQKGAYVSRIIDQTEKILLSAGIQNAQVLGRVKRLYSLYQKMDKHQGDLSKIYDLIAVRAIVQDVEECYVTLGILHRQWKPVPGRIKDYIAQPKPNGYQSLHTTVFTENGEIVEFQIRTLEMHELAEYGVAAHWRYKEGTHKPIRNTQWMEELAQIQKELQNKKNFMEQLEIMKIDVFKDRIFVFTPQGDVIDLPEGATPIDFAYAIHTEVGNKCTAVRINEVMRNIDTSLRSGDIVEVITDKNRRGPNPDWLKFAKTRHARNKIKDATSHTVKGWFAEVLKGREK